jgi:predicted  nucleic acid-binding Zn-ribbon protein
MIKTCELKTCDELHTVELKDVLYSPDSVAIKRVSGETILNLPIDINSIDSRLSYLESLIHNITDESVYKEIEIELNNIRDLVNIIEKDFQNLSLNVSTLSNSLNKLQNSSLNKNDFNNFINDYNNWKNSIQSQVNLNITDISTLKTNFTNLDSQVKKNSEEIENINNSIDTINNKLNDENYINTLLSKELDNGGLKFKNKNGKTIIRFNSSVNYNSDYGYIEYDDDNNTYNYWGDSDENSALIVGVENDVKNSTSDVVVIKSPAGVIIDTNDFIFRNRANGNHFSILDKLGLGIPDYNSGWVSVNQNGLKLSNPLGQNAFFIGYIKYDNGDIMQFGVYSGYEDDDNVDGQDTGVYLVIQPSNLIIAVRKRNNDGTPSAVGLDDGISYSTNVQDTFNAKIIGWKLPNGVV